MYPGHEDQRRISLLPQVIRRVWPCQPQRVSRLSSYGWTSLGTTSSTNYVQLVKRQRMCLCVRMCGVCLMECVWGLWAAAYRFIVLAALYLFCDKIKYHHGTNSWTIFLTATQPDACLHWFFVNNQMLLNRLVIIDQGDSLSKTQHFKKINVAFSDGAAVAMKTTSFVVDCSFFSVGLQLL